MISLFGYGNTTKAIAKQFENVYVFDDKIHKPFKEDGIHFYPSSMFEADKSSREIPSPGIPPSHPLIQQAKHLQSDYDLFAQRFPFSIWITGTNGKTTTTQMITHLLESHGAISGGNIGTAVADMDNQAPIWVLECSSFTLHYTNIAKPNIFVLLPITPDHVGWHGSFEAYEEAKLKPLKQLQEGELAIVPSKYANVKTNGYVITYDEPTDLEKAFGINPTKLKFKGAFLLDAMIALAVQKALYDTIDYEKMNAFILDGHRQEEFLDHQNRLWVNDSKATNPDATIQALKVYEDKTVHLIIGGDDKGASLTELFEYMKNRPITLYGIGKNIKTTQNLAKEYNLNYLKASTLNDAVTMIHKFHGQNSVAMLSPAAASLDQFSSYSERGNQFKEKVLSLS
jgi:UDP-N-acetylmuramoylalanine--D-glutamate ligase